MDRLANTASSFTLDTDKLNNHEFHENCLIRENLICELQYLWWNVLWTIEAKKKVGEILNMNYQLATNSWN